MALIRPCPSWLNLTELNLFSLNKVRRTHHRPKLCNVGLPTDCCIRVNFITINLFVHELQKEKLAIQKGYGKLVNDRNQMELALLKSKRIQAAMMAGDDGLANTA